jgi:uncharacterized ferredoxin-like protein
MNSGIMSQIINISLEELSPMEDSLLSLANIDGMEFLETNDIENLKQRVRVILIGIECEHFFKRQSLQ